MRLFELLILIEFVLFLFIFLFRKNIGKRLRVFFLISITIISFIHIIFEGYRWQMIPSYILILALIVWNIKKINTEKVHKKTGVAYKIIVIISALIFTVIAVATPLLFPVFSFPESSSKFAIGSEARHWIDDTRKDRFEDSSYENRNLMVQIYYPAVPDKTKQRSEYLPHPDVMGSALTEMIGLPGFIFNHFNLIKTNAISDGIIKESIEKYPVIIFSHGLGGMRFQNTYQFEELVRSGYIVIALDHTYDSLITVFPDREIVRFKGDFNGYISDQDGKEKMETWVEDIEFVLEKIEDLNIEGKFKNKIDIEKIGIMGHSFGGATSLHTLFKDPRLKAGLNMDGYIFEDYEMSLEKPFMLMRSEEIDFSQINKEDFEKMGISLDRMKQTFNKFNKRAETISNNSTADFYQLRIDNTNHISFTDYPLYSPLLSMNILEADYAHTIINDYTVSFFDKYLKNKEIDLSELNSKYDEVKIN